MYGSTLSSHLSSNINDEDPPPPPPEFINDDTIAKQQDNNDASSSNSSSSSSENDPVTYKEHFYRMFNMAMCFALTFYCIFSFTLTASAFVGRKHGPKALSGFGLGVCFINLLGFSTITGLAMGLDTLLPQAFGMSPTHPEIAKLVQRAFGSVLIWCLVVAVMFVSAPHWFHFIFADSEGDEEVAVYAGRTVELAAMALVPYLAEEVLQSYLGAMSKVFETLSGALCAAIVNPIFLFLFVNLGWIGFDGAVVSWALSIVVMFLSTVLISKYRGAFDGTWTGFDCNVMFTHWMPFLRVGVPACLQLLCEWSVFEINGFAAAKILPPKQFTAQVMMQQITTFLFPAVLGISIAINVLVGNDVGAKKPESAKRTALVGTLALFVEFIFDAIIIYSPIMANIGKLFTEDEEVLSHFERAFKIAFLSHVFDSLFCMFGSIIRALGHQRIGFRLAFAGYWIIGLPLGWLLAIYVMDENDKILALWIGPVVGQFVAATLAGYYVLCRMKWEQTEEIKNNLIQEEVAEEDK